MTHANRSPLQGPWWMVGAWGFAWFFCVLASYYVIRPVRETIGGQLGSAELQKLFPAVFLLMLILNPLYAWLVARAPRRLLVHLTHRVFEACLLGFWFFWPNDDQAIPVGLARAFFIWVSIFNLFVVSMFWSFAADIFNKEQAKRSFGILAAGGTLGAIAGSYAAGALVERIGIAGLLWIPLVLLQIASLFMEGMHRSAKYAREVTAPSPTIASSAISDEPVGGSIWAGARRILQSPYLLGICGILLFSQFCGTTAYLQQSEIVPAAVKDRSDQLQVYSSINLWGQVLTVVLQSIVAGPLMRYAGLSVTLCVLPLVYLGSFLALSFESSLLILGLSQVVQRGTGLGLMVPAEHALFTVVSREDKYKAKSFIDTVVFRGGDALASWLFAQLRAAQWTLTHVSYLMVPLIALWTIIAWRLGRRDADRKNGMVETHASSS